MGNRLSLRWGVARLQEGCPDLLVAILLPRGTSLADNEKKTKKNKAQKWKKDTIPDEVNFESLDPTGVKVRPTSTGLWNHLNQTFSLDETNLS